MQQFESILERVSTTLQRACTEVANLSHAVEHKEDVFEGVAGATKVGNTGDIPCYQSGTIH